MTGGFGRGPVFSFLIVYMSSYDSCHLGCSFGHKLMPHVLQASAATGGLSAAVVSTVLSALSNPLPPVTCQDILPQQSSELHWPSILLGILLGIILGQLFESLVLARHCIWWQLRQRWWAFSNSLSIKGRVA